MLKFAIQGFKENREFKQISKATLTYYMGSLQEFHKYSIEMEIVDITDVLSYTFKTILLIARSRLQLSIIDKFINQSLLRGK